MAKFDHMAFQVSSLDEAIKFYSEKLDFVLSWRHANAEEQEECAFLKLGELNLELLEDQSGAVYEKPEIRSPYCPHLAIEIDDMQQAVARLEERGVPIIRGPLKIEGEVTWVYFADPDNNVLEYIQWIKRKS